MNQVRANSKKKLSSEQMKIKKELTQKQSAIKIEVFDRVREKLLEYRKTNDYLVYLENQIKNIMSEYSDVDITIYIDPNDSSLLDELPLFLKKTFLLTILLKHDLLTNRIYLQ